MAVEAASNVSFKKEGWQKVIDNDEMRGTSNTTYTIFSNDKKIEDKVGLTFNLQKPSVMFIPIGDKFDFDCLKICSVAIKFDDNPVEEFPFKAASLTSIFHMPFPLSDPTVSEKFIQKIKTSKRMIVELHLMNKIKQFKFATDGFQE
jgi:hypothetical protein